MEFLVVLIVVLHILVVRAVVYMVKDLHPMTSIRKAEMETVRLTEGRKPIQVVNIALQRLL